MLKGKAAQSVGASGKLGGQIWERSSFFELTMLGVRTRAQGTDAITSYFDNLERPGAGKKSRGWQDSKALKRVPQVSPFLSSKGKSEDSDEEDSLLSLRRLLRFVFSRDR